VTPPKLARLRSPAKAALCATGFSLPFPSPVNAANLADWTLPYWPISASKPRRHMPKPGALSGMCRQIGVDDLNRVKIPKFFGQVLV
jgi:hypothetical protein